MSNESRVETSEYGGDFVIIDLSQLGMYFQSAADVQRLYKLSPSTVRKACGEGRIRSWMLGRDYIVLASDAARLWGERE